MVVSSLNPLRPTMDVDWSQPDASLYLTFCCLKHDKMDSETFFASLQKRILDRSVHTDNKMDCIVWQGALKACGHGVMKVKFPNGERLVRGVHQLMYYCHKHILIQPEGLEISHLCHVPSCVQVSHLVAEPRQVNASRITCKLEGKCSQTHIPPCLFPSD